MVSIEQIAILEQKVESAVEKIAQLTAENDALRSKCVELTNALSAKTEQLSAFQSDQNKIEIGIMKALEQLKSLEGTIVPKESQTSDENQEKSESENQVEEQAVSLEIQETKEDNVSSESEGLENQVEKDSEVSQNENLIEQKEVAQEVSSAENLQESSANEDDFEGSFEGSNVEETAQVEQQNANTDSVDSSENQNQEPRKIFDIF